MNLELDGWKFSELLFWLRGGTPCPGEADRSLRADISRGFHLYLPLLSRGSPPTASTLSTLIVAVDALDKSVRSREVVSLQGRNV